MNHEIEKKTNYINCKIIDVNNFTSIIDTLNDPQLSIINSSIVTTVEYSDGSEKKIPFSNIERLKKELKPIKKVEINYFKSNRAKNEIYKFQFKLEHGDSKNGSFFLVESHDIGWLNIINSKFETLNNSFDPQFNIPLVWEYLAKFILSATWVVAIFKINLTKNSDLAFLLFFTGIGFLILSLIYALFQTLLFPNIELQIGMPHTFKEKKGRNILTFLSVNVVLPLIMAGATAYADSLKKNEQTGAQAATKVADIDAQLEKIDLDKKLSEQMTKQIQFKVHNLKTAYVSGEVVEIEIEVINEGENLLRDLSLRIDIPGLGVSSETNKYFNFLDARESKKFSVKARLDNWPRSDNLIIIELRGKTLKARFDKEQTFEFRVN